MKNNSIFFMALCVLLLPFAACAGDYVIILKDHKFTPYEFVIPPNRKVRLTIRNLDATPALFASWDLQREKLIDPHGETIAFIGPLDPGPYSYYDDFHHFAEKPRRDTTKGIHYSQIEGDLCSV